MVALQPLVAEFVFEGRLENLVISSKGRVKYLNLATLDGDYLISVAKEQAGILSKHLQPGCCLKVTGMRKYKLHQDEVQYKAYRIELLPELRLPEKTIVKTPPAKAKILVCQGSSCSKQGGKAVCQMLQQELVEKGLIGKVEIKVTGCMKQCKQAPVLVMPARKTQARVQPRQVSGLLESYREKLARNKS
ncbi:MAG: (2Fe-2S) ferredoxin domain-containing protein [Cyanobacteria bacterium J06623_1]